MSKEKEILVCNYDVLFNSTVKPSSVYKYFQQIAREDLDSFGLTFKKLCEMGIAFVLVKMKSKFYKPIFCYDNLKLVSAHRKVKGATFIRDYLLYRDGELVGETSSYWALIDINTRKICRPSVLNGMIGEPTELCSFEIDDKFVFPDGVEKSWFSYTAKLGDIDENRHMNNTRYLDVCLDAVSDFNENDFVSEIKIDFLNEVRQNEFIFLEYTKDRLDGKIYFSATNKNTQLKCFDAIITFEGIK